MKAISPYVYRLVRKPFLIGIVMTAMFALTTVTVFMQSIKPAPPSTAPAQLPACDSRVGVELPKGAPGKEANAPSPPGVIPATVETAANYTFSTATNASFTDMSSGTTTLVAAAQDDVASVLTNIGFDFYLLGTRYTTFSASSNGYVRLGGVVATTQYTLGTPAVTLIASYGSDEITSTTGKVHYKVTGAAPNRVLTIEFLNQTIIYDGAGATADGTSQVRLYESTGVVELVYGGMNRNSSTGFGGGMDPQYIGFSTNSTANTFATVNVSTNAVNTTGTVTSNQPTLGAAIPNINTPVNGSRRIYSFTPPVPTAPTGLTFTGVTPLAMTLNWTDSPDESLYAVFRSTDGVNYAFETTLAQNSVSYSPSGLNPSTNYFWQVYAVSDGAFSTALSGSQMTTAPGNVASTAAGGPWSSTATWAGGIVPSSTDNVTIVNGATVTVDTAAVALSLTVGTGGAATLLQFDSAVARTLTVGTSVTIASNGTVQSATTGTVTTHVFSVGTNLTNNGVLDLSTNGNTAGAGLTFTGAASNTFSGTGATTDIRTMTINKGTSSANVLELNTSNFTVQGTTTDGTPMAFLTLTNGTLKVSGTFTVAGRVFTAAAYTIGATAGFWLNNPNFTVSGQSGSPTMNGLLRISQGTFNMGTVSGNAMGAGTGAVFTIDGGTFNISGRLLTANAVTYTQSGGTVNVCTVGNASSLTQSFGLTSASTTFNMSGGTINLIQINSTATAGNRRDYSVLGTANITGGTLNVGTAATTGNAGNFDFRIGGQVPALVINNTTNNKNVILISQMNTFGNVTVNTGCSVNTGANVWLVIGTTVTNNGTITVPTNLSRFYFLGSGPQTYTGSGTTTIVTASGSVDLTVDNAAGLTIDPASNGIITQRVNFFHGGITNANKLTLGNAGTTVGVVQYGLASSPDTAGNFDVAPTFNIGTGGETILYAQEGTARTTGPEIPPSRTITNTSISNTNGVIVAGGDLTLAPTTGTSTLTLTAGNITTNANTLILNSAATVARTSGHIIGNFRKAYAAAGSKLFEVGTANGFSPVTVNITAGTFPADFTVKAVQGPQPNILSPTHALQRYWTLTATGVTADLTFNYIDPTDIPVTAVEANFVILKYDGAFSMPGGSVNTVANTASITGVTVFSDWTIGEPGSPTDVALNGFSAEPLAASPSAPQGGVLLRWQTGFEVANLGFNIYRDEAGNRTRINPSLIAGSAFFVGARTVLGAGRSYVWRDTQSLKSKVQYWLEEVDINGHSFLHGPLIVEAGKPAADAYEPNARLLSDLGDDQNAATATHTVTRFAKPRQVTAAALVKQQGLAGNSTIKIIVNREGWYQIKAADLIAAGLDGRSNPQFLQLFVDGREQPINVSTNTGGGLSGIEFYGTTVNNPYTNERAYWLVVGATSGKRIPQVTSAGNAAPGGSFLATVERRDRTIYFSSLRNGERENFFGAVISHDPVDQTLTLARVNSNAATAATLEVALQGVTSQAHSVNVEINGNYAGTMAFAGQASAVASFNVAHAQLHEGANTVRLVPMGGAGDASLVDYLRLSYQHYNTADGETLRLTATGGQAVTLDGFSKPAIRVLDITDANAVQELIGAVQQQKGGSSVSLQVPGTGVRTLLALASDLPSPASVAANLTSSWRQPLNGADLVVITCKEFAASLNPLVSLRQRQGLSVAVVYIDDVYDEFSFGQKTPQALKDFLVYAATSWKKKPRFVLLAADASFDPKNYLGGGNTDLVPTKLFDTQYMETACDDWMVDFNNDGVPELAIGRLPARTASEALTMATKIARYNSQPPAETLLLVSDLSDTFDFTSASESLRALIPSEVRALSLHRGDADDQTTHARLLAAINSGQRLVNYIGHGSVDLWRGNLLTAADVSNLTNNDRLTVFVMMTCLNGYYTDPALGSLGKELLKSERGGAVAVWASSGMTLPDAQAVMNQEAYRQMFGSQGLTIGEVMMQAKAAVANGDVRRTWILLGDPTMKLR